MFNVNWLSLPALEFFHTTSWVVPYDAVHDRRQKHKFFRLLEQCLLPDIANEKAWIIYNWILMNHMIHKTYFKYWRKKELSTIPFPKLFLWSKIFPLSLQLICRWILLCPTDLSWRWILDRIVLLSQSGGSFLPLSMPVSEGAGCILHQYKKEPVLAKTEHYIFFLT